MGTFKDEQTRPGGRESTPMEIAVNAFESADFDDETTFFDDDEPTVPRYIIPLAELLQESL